MKALMTTWRNEVVVKITFGKSNPIYSRPWCFQLSYMIYGFGQVTWQLPLEGFWEGVWRDIWCLMSNCILQQHTIFCWPEFGKQPIKLNALKPTIGFQQWHIHLPSSWLVSQATLLSQHPAERDLTPSTNWQPCRRNHGVCLNGKWQIQHH